MDNFVKFRMKQFDTEPFNATLVDRNGAPANLVGATVNLVLSKRETGINVANSPMTISNAASGTVQYLWGPNETDEPGELFGEIKVLYANGLLQSFPSAGYFVIEIDPSL